MDFVQVQNLCKNYPDAALGEFKALDKVSFVARAGEVFGLLGPNGAGKTTALRILAPKLDPHTARMDGIRNSLGRSACDPTTGCFSP